MSEEHDIFEEMFKDSLQDIEIPVSEGLWNRIKISIWGRRKYFFLLWFFIGLIGIALGTYLFGEMKNNNDETKIARNNSNTIKNTSKTEVNKANDLNSPNILLNNKDTIILKQSTSTETINNTNKVNNKSEVASTITKKGYSKNVASNESIKENKTNDAITNSKTKTKNTIQENKTAILPINSAIVNKSGIFESKADSNKIILSNAIVSADSLRFSDSLKALQTDTISSITKAKVDSLPKLDSIKTGQPETSKSRYFINADAGLLFPSITYDSPNANLAHTINHNTKPVINYNFNAQLGCSIRKNINVLVGIGYVSYKNNYNYSTNFKTKDTIAAEYIDSLGNTIYYTYYKDTTKIIKLNKINQFKYLTIPITAEYIFKLSTRFSLRPSLGLILHQQIKSEITWIDPESNKIIFKNNSDQKSFFISISGGLKMEYQINKNWGAILSGTYIHSLTDINKTYEDLKTRPNAVNANVGLRYYFYCK